MKTNYIQKLMLTAILLLSVAFTANAQQNPKYVCDTDAATAINLALDMGNGFNAAGGKWYKLPASGNYTQATPTTIHLNGSAYDLSSTFEPENVVGNIFLVAGKTPGRYDFVFKPTANSGVTDCIPETHRRLATVIVLEAPKPVSYSLSLCKGETGTLDLATLVSNTLPTPVYTATIPTTTGSLSGSNLTINAAFEGQIKIGYSVTHTGAPANFCNASTITINVSREGQAPTLLGQDNVTYCATETPASLNLNTKLTTTVAGGVWKEGTTPVPNGGIVTFTNPPTVGARTFTYDWPAAAGGCYEAGSVTFTVTISADLSSFATTLKEIDVCKSTNPDAVINMLQDGLGLNIPLSTGTWSVVSQVSNIDVTDGLFEVAEAKLGTYEYKYTTSNAIGCGLELKEFTLKINVTDTLTQDERIAFCISDLNANGTSVVNLSGQIQDLPAGATWTTTLTGFTGASSTAGTPPVTTTTITGGNVTKAQLAAKGVGVHKFDYSYASGTCGNSTGSLYVTITDKLDMEDATVKYCRPDLPTELNLNNIIGVNVPGSWSIGTATGSGTGTGSVGTTPATNHLFTETSGGGERTYTVTFTPDNPTTDGEDHCGAKPVTVTIIVTENVF